MESLKEEHVENGGVSHKRSNAQKKKPSSKLKRRKQKRNYYSGDSEDEKLKSRLLKKTKFKKRNSKSNQQNKDTVPLVHHIKPKTKEKSSSTSTTPTPAPADLLGRYEILNPESYRRLVCRFEENQINKAPKPSTGDFIESRYVCCLCQRPSTGGNLGDLFGPYYCKISEAFWPPYLKQKPKKHQDTYTDFWFHGYCALWTSGILAKGNILTGLDEHLGDYWKQVAFCEIFCLFLMLLGYDLSFVKSFLRYRNVQRAIMSERPSDV